MKATVHFTLCAALALLLGIVSCSEDASNSPADALDAGEDIALTPETARGFGAAVGVRTATLDTARGALTVELWYPAAAAGPADSALSFITNADDRARYATALAAPSSCATEQTRAERDASPVAVAPASLPLVVVSHCHHCTRFSLYSIAEQLTSRGFVVVAPDHLGNTLFDRWAGNEAPLSNATLDNRTADLRAVIDGLETLDPALANLIDVERLALVGHSFGAVTVGTIAQSEPRVRAVAALATPMENPLLPGVEIDDISAPMMFVLAEEDNSISTLGNIFIEQNHESAANRAWLLRLADAGHWSFTNIAGADESVQPGCGDDERMTNGAPFSYPPVADVTQTVADAVTLFLMQHLSGSDAATQALDQWAASLDTFTPPSPDPQ